MTTFVAQIMPGMQWIPVMLMLSAIGVLLGFVSLACRPFRVARDAGRRLGRSALLIGVMSPLLLGILAGHIRPMAYFIVALPAFIGGAAVALYPKNSPQPRGLGVLPMSDERSKAEWGEAVAEE